MTETPAEILNSLRPAGELSTADMRRRLAYYRDLPKATRDVYLTTIWHRLTFPMAALVAALLGVALFRAGKWSEALAELGTSMELSEGGDAFDFFFVAMAHTKLGHPKPIARSFYNQAVTWMEEHNPDHPAFVHLRDEATELLGAQP